MKGTKGRLGLAMGLAGLGVLLVAGTMQAATTNNVIWSGGAGPGSPAWDVDANWLGGEAPANPSAATIYFKTNGQAVVGLLEADRQIGGVYFDAGPIYSNIAHVVDMGGRVLTLAGNMTGLDYRGWNFRLTNGTLRLGTAATAANLTIGRLADATLTLGPGASLDPLNLGSVSLGEHNSSGQGTAILDLRGCQVVGGVLRMRSLSLMGYWRSSYVYLDGNTGISSIEVSNTVSLGASWGPGAWSGDSTYVGNPADSGRLPANISLNIGSSPEQRGNLIVNRLISSSYVGTRTDKIVATSGGTFTAYLTNLWVAANGVNAGDSAPQYGLLDISRMNACSVDALDVRLGVPASPLSTDNIKGEWRVCPGTVTAGTVVAGATAGRGYGLLTMSNTTFTVTNALTINRTGRVEISVGSQSSGLAIANAADTALSLATATNAALRIVFREPYTTRPHYGLAWAGDHVQALQGLQADGRLVVDSAGLAPKTASIFRLGGTTYVGIPAEDGSMMLIH